MLFPGLQSQNIAALSFSVRSFTYDTARQLPHQLIRSRHKSHVGTAESQRHAQRLSVADCNIRAVFTGCLEQPQRNGIYPHDDLCARLMGNPGQCISVFNISVEVRALEINACRFLSAFFAKSFRIGHAVLFRNNFQGYAAALAVSLHYLQHHRMHGSGNKNLRPLPVNAHENGFRCCGSTVIHRCIGYIHSGKFADFRLIFKNRLQDTLADFRLIRCIGCTECFLSHHLLHNGRNEVTVRTGTAENRRINRIFLSHPLQSPQNFQLALPGRKIYFLFVYLSGDRCIQLIY